MKKQIKKGFTLVELLVVIAIIAILSVVSVVGYTSFTKKAKVSNDVSLTKEMNTILDAEVAGGKTYATPHEAVVDLEDGGLIISKLTPTSDNYIFVLNINGSQGEKVLLLDENYKVKAPEGAVLNTNKTDYFTFVSSSKEIDKYTKEGYSVYLKDSFDGNTVTVSSGIDVGDNVGIDVEYKNTTSTAKEVIIRTNGGNLVIDDTNLNSQQIHYGDSEKVEITTGTSCYHEYGDVEVLIAKAGKVIAESGSKVSVAVSQTNASIEVKSNAVVETKSENVSEDDANKLANAVAVVGTTPYDSVEAAIAGASEGNTVKLLKDVSSSATININKALTLDGNGHKLTTTVETTSIMSVSGTADFTLKNLIVYASKQIKKGAAGGVNADISINTSGKVTIEGCTFDGISGAYYNVIEFGGDTVVKNGTSFINNTFVGTSIGHNCINIFTEEENATIYLTGNKFKDISTSSTNPIRISDYTNTAVTFEIKDNEYSYIAASNSVIYDGFALIQNNKGGVENIKLNFTNLMVNGNVATSNNQGTHDQVYYIYTDSTRAVTFDGLKGVTFNK